MLPALGLWRPTRNDTLGASGVPAWTGSYAAWTCGRSPDHESSAQVRSHSLRVTGHGALGAT
jgi:hypothetical protein